jgi:hypothetical protein
MGRPSIRRRMLKEGDACVALRTVFQPIQHFCSVDVQKLKPTRNTSVA